MERSNNREGSNKLKRELVFGFNSLKLLLISPLNNKNMIIMIKLLN
jgi:hypothetical protein